MTLGHGSGGRGCEIPAYAGMTVMGAHRLAVRRGVSSAAALQRFDRQAQPRNAALLP